MRRALLTIGLLLGACDGADDGEATLRFTAWGEDFIEQGIPADAFSDGWSVEFDAFFVSLGGIDADGAPLQGTYVVDLSEVSDGSGHELGTILAPASGEPRVTYALTPAVADAISDMDVAELEQMAAAGASVWARGTATKGAERKTFDWTFDVSPRYVACETGTTLSEGTTTDVVLTLHADHLFYDDLDSEEPDVAFDLIAQADADGDGAVTMDELRQQDISGQVRYQVGGRAIDDLYGFIEAQTRTLGHINGEGHCEIE